MSNQSDKNNDLVVFNLINNNIWLYHILKFSQAHTFNHKVSSEMKHGTIITQRGKWHTASGQTFWAAPKRQNSGLLRIAQSTHNGRWSQIDKVKCMHSTQLSQRWRKTGFTSFTIVFDYCFWFSLFDFWWAISLVEYMNWLSISKLQTLIVTCRLKTIRS